MELSYLAIYVDGPTEEEALKGWFCKYFQGKHPAFRYGPGNGVHYAVQGYANNVAPKIVQNLKTEIRHILIMPDFEKREKKLNVTLDDFQEQLKSAIISKCAEISDFTVEYLETVIHVCPSNIMFENWIICDVDGIKHNKLIKITGDQEQYDGRNGSSILSSMMEIKYKKTTHAKVLYKCVDPNIGIVNSPSYKQFYEKIMELHSI